MAYLEKNSKISISSKNGLMEKALKISESKNKDVGLLNKTKIYKSRAKGTTKAIIETNGIFSIKKDLETSSVKQDPRLKELVDSVLR